MRPRVLVAGVGNVFLGDDGFGVAVARRLADAALPDGVKCVDYGVRALHLAYELLDLDGAALVMVDAVARGDAPGALAVLEPQLDDAALDDAAPDAHTMHPAVVLRLARDLGARVGKVRIVACEPAAIDTGMTLSAPVAAAVDAAAKVALALAADLARETGQAHLEEAR